MTRERKRIYEEKREERQKERKKDIERETQIDKQRKSAENEITRTLKRLKLFERVS